MPKKISVIIPCYNYGHLLQRAVESVAADALDDYEVLIIDDGSTDNSFAVASDLASKHPEKVSCFTYDNAGLAATRNRGIDHSIGEYLIFLDADDELCDNALELLRRELRENDVDVLIGGHHAVNQSGDTRYHSPGFLLESPVARVKSYLLDKQLVLSNGAVAMSRKVFTGYRYPEEFRCSEDLSVFTYLISNFICKALDEPVCLVHKHDDSLRHNAQYSSEVGLRIVGEVFNADRLPTDVMGLQDAFYIQRCLSMCRTAFRARDYHACRRYFGKAVIADWRVLFKLSYSGKFFRALLRWKG